MLKRILPIAMTALALAVPAASFAQKTTVKSATAATMTKTIAPVNVNTATIMQLETLPGIGPKIAAEIVKNRPYKDAKEFEAKVKGIGPKTWLQIEKYVLFK